MTDTACPWMFLVRIPKGRKPQVFRIDPFDVPRWACTGDQLEKVRRAPRAWLMTVTPGKALHCIGVAAVANSVDEA